MDAETHQVTGNPAWIFSLLCCLTQPALAVVTTENETWKGNEGSCFYILNDEVYAEKLQKLAMAALHHSDETTGCITYPYLGQPYYDPVIKNFAHAGIDFRANNVPVYAVEGGQVIVKSFNLSSDPPHSTLIIENKAKTRKTLYLHMKRIDVDIGDICAGAQIGLAGGIGAHKPHLHFEVWPSSSHLYATRKSAISGSACGGECAANEIERLTVNPASLIMGVTLEKPNTPYEDWGACPFECCRYSDWIAKSPVTVYQERDVTSRVVFRLITGESAHAVTGVVVTHSVGRIEIKKPFHGPAYLRDDNTVLLSLRPGDIVYSLHYAGEGYDVVWYRGKVYIGEFSDETLDKASRQYEVLSRPKTAWWAKIRNKAGKTGWTLETDKFGNQDECG